MSITSPAARPTSTGSHHVPAVVVRRSPESANSHSTAPRKRVVNGSGAKTRPSSRRGTRSALRPGIQDGTKVA
ncbi:MAG: hypothetical protein WKF43_17225 [Acidimicrobiales bacterium]